MKVDCLKNKKGISIEGPLVFTPDIYSDSRGLFFESWNRKKYEENLPDTVHFVQDNHSESSQGVLRGMHYQIEPYPQGKLVRCIKGSIFDVAVDIRKSSSTFSEWVGIELNQKNKKQLWIPCGFAHGFLTLSESAEVLYKASGYWNKDCERTIQWNDKAFNIQWPIENLNITDPLLSDKDANASSLGELLKNDELFL